MGLHYLKFPANNYVNKAISILANSPLVEYVETNHLYYTNVAPNDTHFDKQWGAENTAQLGGFFDADMDLPEA